MSVETNRLEELGRELGEAIAESSVYEEFEEKKEAVEADEEAQEKLKDFQDERQDFMMARQAGDATPEDFAHLQQRQYELNQLPVMAEYMAAQAALEERLGEIDAAISEPLAVEFGEMGGSCCQD